MRGARGSVPRGTAALREAARRAGACALPGSLRAPSGTSAASGAGCKGDGGERKRERTPRAAALPVLSVTRTPLGTRACPAHHALGRGGSGLARVGGAPLSENEHGTEGAGTKLVAQPVGARFAPARA